MSRPLTGPALAVVPPYRRAKEPQSAQSRAELYREALVRKEMAPRTVDLYTRIVRNCDWWCEEQGYSLRNVPAVVLGQYVSLQPKSHASRRHLRSSLKHYWELFKRKDAPLWMVQVPRKPRPVSRALTDEEAAKMAALARQRGGKEGLGVLLAMYQGLRREEISAVAWHDFTDDGWLRVMGKGSVAAKLPLHPVVAEALTTVERRHPVWVFPAQKLSAKDRHAAPATIWTWVRRLAAEAGLEHVTPHRLRHTCLAVANDVTGDLRAVQDFARHADISTTQGYTRVTVRRLMNVMRAIDYDEGAAERGEAEQRILGQLRALTLDDLHQLSELIASLEARP